MPPPHGEGMSGSPPLDLPHPCARAGDPTGVPLTPATRREATSFLLRHHKLAPDDGAGVKDLRPLTRSALSGPILDPDTATGAAQKRRRTKEKRSTSRGTASLTGQVPSRDDKCHHSHLGGAGDDIRDRTLCPRREGSGRASRHAGTRGVL